MSDKTAIQWADATWNPVFGCTKVSPGCANCYIERTPPYRMAKPKLEFVRGHIPIQLKPERLSIPLRWRKPRMVFVNSLSDTFHEDVPDEFIMKMFGVMAIATQHTFLVLTKRPERLKTLDLLYFNGTETLPLPNVWLGVTAESQRMAEERIPILLDTPAARRFVSVEPMLGAVNLQPFLEGWGYLKMSTGWEGWMPGRAFQREERIDWVIAGGESAGPEHRRLVERNRDAAGVDANQAPRHLPVLWEPKWEALTWLRSLRDQCQTAGVPFHFKQWGGPTPKSAGRLLDGREWNEVKP